MCCTLTSGVTVRLYISLFLSSCNALEMVYSVQTASVRENNNIYNRSPERQQWKTVFLLLLLFIYFFYFST